LADLVTLTTKQRPKLPATASRAADGG
jgi:hypothetical protein